MRFIVLASLALPLISCSKKDDHSKGKTVVVKAGALAISPAALKQVSASLLGGPKDPDYANGEYDGMGVSTSDAVVEGFKITLKSVTLSSKTASANSFPIANGELDISAGVNSTVSVTGVLEGGIWDRVSVAYEPNYKLTAYAYMDSNNDGTIDKTVFTTAAEVKAMDGRLTKAEMLAAGYAEYKYGFAFTHCSDSVTNSTKGNCGMISVFPEPFNVDAPIKTAEGEATPSTHIINILIDSTKVVRGWIGTSGNYMTDGAEPSTTFLGNPSIIPMSVGFPLSDVCSDTKNEWGLNSCDFFPYGKPAFGLAYIPVYAFLNENNLSSQVYLVSTEAGIWNHYNSGAMQFVVKNDVPQMGLVFSSTGAKFDFTTTPAKFVSSAGPVLGATSRLFEKQADSTYTFYMDGHNKDANGVDDGGLYYNNDKSMAGHIVSGFKITDIGETQTITLADGPRCKGEYDYCVGNRTYYVKRLK